MIGRRLRSTTGATRTRGEAGFSIVEALIAIVILAVVGFALHRATLSALRYMQMGKARAAQAKLLEHAIDWTRSEMCFLKSTLSPGLDYKIALHDGTVATLRWVESPPNPSDPSGDSLSMRTVEIELRPGHSSPGVKQTVLLDMGICG